MSNKQRLARFLSLFKRGTSPNTVQSVQLTEREKLLLDRELLESGLLDVGQSGSVLSPGRDMFGLRTGTKIGLDDELRTHTADLPNVGRLTISPAEQQRIMRERED